VTGFWDEAEVDGEKVPFHVTGDPNMSDECRRGLRLLAAAAVRRAREQTRAAAADGRHACPVPGCRVRELPYHVLMCRLHWARVPSLLRREVYRTWNDGDIREGYWAARGRAIAAASGGGETDGRL